MIDIATLVLRVVSNEVRSAVDELRRLAGQAGNADRATSELGRSMKGVVAQIGAFVSVAAGLKKLVEVSREFDVINASIITATGSAENAKAAFESIQEFATTTPYSLQQVSNAFIKLVNLGLDPSERALTSYGNTAAAMGKDLNQMIEAVADAATGEFERLKEFGIKSKSEGDNVSFTFRGITTTVKKNAEEIEGYLLGLGENEFGGAMAERAKTLDGAISNLGDSWNKLFLSVSQQGAGTVIYDSVKLAESGLSSLIDMMESGQVNAYVGAMASSFDGFGRDVSSSLDILESSFDEFFKGIGGDGFKTADFIAVAFNDALNNIRTTLQLITVESAAMIDRLKIESSSMTASLAGDAYWLLEKVGLAETALAQGMLKEWRSAYAGSGGLLEQLKAVNDARDDSRDSILSERTASRDSFEEQLTNARKLREEYDKKKEAGGKGGVLGQYKIEGGGDSGPSKDELKAREKADRVEQALRDQQLREIETIRQSLLTKEQLESESYLRRIQLLQSSADAGLITQQRADAMARDLHKQHQDAMLAEEEARSLKIRERAAADLESVVRSVQTEAEQVNAAYQQKMAALEQARALGIETTVNYDVLETQLAQEKEAKLTAIAQQAADERTRINEQEMRLKFATAQSIFGNLATLMNSHSKKAFQIGKAAAMANAVVNTAEGVTKALSAFPPPFNFAAAGAVAAAGMVQIQGIRAQQFGGGGSVSMGGGGSAPNVYRPPQPTMQRPADQGRGPNVTPDSRITIVNQTTGRIDKVDERRISPEERVLIIREAQAAVAADMSDPNSNVSRSLTGNYSVQRAR
jgi:phage tail tape-measure protein